MIESILPDCVAVSESFGEPNDVECLFPEEEAAIRNAVDRRRREFAAVRRCARLALAELGQPAAAIVPGEKREPRWPAGIVGSMTHCDGYRAAAVADARLIASVGIDAEPHAPLPGETLAVIARPEEVPLLAELGDWLPDVYWDRLAFSAKESVYKAWYPIAGRWLGFEDATLSLDPATRVFTAELHETGPLVGGVPLTRMVGRWLVGNGLIVTAVALPLPAREASGAR